MAFQDKYGNSTDNIQDAADMKDKVYNQRITDRVSEYLSNPDDIDDAIINSSLTLQSIRLLHKSWADGNKLGIETWAKTICMNIDSYLINRANKEI